MLFCNFPVILGTFILLSVQKVSWWNPVKREHHAFSGGGWERTHTLLNHVNLTCHNFYVIKKQVIAYKPLLIPSLLLKFLLKIQPNAPIFLEMMEAASMV